MRRRYIFIALLLPLPALAAPPRPAAIEAQAPAEPVRTRRPRLGRGVSGGRRPHWSRNYTAAGRPRGGRHF
jgi:hypothetical protein